MAAAPQQQALDVIKAEVMSIDERYDGYQRDLIATLYNILTLESDKPHNINQQVAGHISALGENLIRNEGNIK